MKLDRPPRPNKTPYINCIEQLVNTRNITEGEERKFIKSEVIVYTGDAGSNKTRQRPVQRGYPVPALRPGRQQIRAHKQHQINITTTTTNNNTKHNHMYTIIYIYIYIMKLIMPPIVMIMMSSGQAAAALSEDSDLGQNNFGSTCTWIWRRPKPLRGHLLNRVPVFTKTLPARSIPILRRKWGLY